MQAALWGLRYEHFTASARERFGSTYTVCLGTTPPAVVTTDRDAIRRLLTGDPLSRRAANDVLRPLIGDRSVLLLAPQEHLARRKLLLPPFHGERIEAYRAIVDQLVDEELRRWRPGEVITMLTVAQRVTLDVIMRAVLGIEDAALRADLRELIEDLTGYPVIPLRRRLPGSASRSVVAEIGRGRGIFSVLAGLPTPTVMTYFPRFKTRSGWNVLTIPFFALLDRLLR